MYFFLLDKTLLVKNTWQKTIYLIYSFTVSSMENGFQKKISVIKHILELHSSNDHMQAEERDNTKRNLPTIKIQSTVNNIDFPNQQHRETPTESTIIQATVS